MADSFSSPSPSPSRRSISDTIFVNFDLAIENRFIAVARSNVATVSCTVSSALVSRAILLLLKEGNMSVSRKYSSSSPMERSLFVGSSPLSNLSSSESITSTSVFSLESSIESSSPEALVSYSARSLGSIGVSMKSSDDASWFVADSETPLPNAFSGQSCRFDNCRRSCVGVPPSSISTGNDGTISGDPVRHKNNHSRSSLVQRMLEGPNVEVEYTVLIAARACGNLASA
mmetsp:Transcript_4500/g.8355  ORF Transcript_4500/g.8355 Transcript_4500/m.8355 type:complete len:230 (-) Transcript_4500:931-1620(-)